MPRAEMHPRDVLPSEAGVEALDQIYDSDPLFGRISETAARLVRQLCGMAWDSRFLRILEIGDGTGALAASLLPVLPSNRSEYVLTHPDETALAQVQARFAGWAGLRCTPLDLAGDLAEPRFGFPQFDIPPAAALMPPTPTPLPS